MKKLIVISGGSRGIGKAVIHKFASMDFDIITCSRNQEGLDELEAEVSEVFPEAEIYSKVADLSKSNEVADFIEYIKSTKRKVDVLVNNSGVFVQGSIYNEKEGVLEEMINTNLYSAYRLTRGVIPLMIAAKKGHVFNICSTASIIPYVNGGSYCISKFALYGMSKVLREEMKPFDIKVTSILPGATKTSSWDGVDLPDERFIKPEDVADAVAAVYSLSGQANVEEILIRPQLGDL